MVKVKRIYVNTDSMNAIHLFTHDKRMIQKWGLKRKSYKKILSKYLAIKKLFGEVEIIYSHIKAHKSTSTPATWVNQWCDTEAKAQMHKKLTQLNKPSNHKKNDKPNHQPANDKLHSRPTTTTKASSSGQGKQHNDNVHPCSDMGISNDSVRVDDSV